MYSILPRLRGRARGESAAINPNHHRQLRPRVFRWNPDIEKQAIFAAAGVAKVHVAKNSSLHAMRAKLRGLAHAAPFCCGCRRLPAQFADRGRSVWDSKKYVDCSVLLALDN